MDRCINRGGSSFFSETAATSGWTSRYTEPVRALHSGHYGNWAPNPAMELARLLAAMKDADGRVLIDGYYDDVMPLSDLEKKALAEMPVNDADLEHELGIAKPEGGRKEIDGVACRSLRSISAGC